ncbi:MAG: glutamate racemase [Spirochaetaceae bacterium]|jgi:glutamate racemase|nr:glutamate racemase [Spirochaetaceae bacterium]
MSKRRDVLFLDSGVGGLPYCKHFARHNPQYALCYVADREHFPYGAKSRSALVDLLCRLIEQLQQKIEPALVVLACNTASISALNELRIRFPEIDFVGTVPAVRPAILDSRKGKVGVLGTERTITDDYISKLARETGRNAEIIRLAAPSLVDFIEYEFIDAPQTIRSETAVRWTNLLREQGVDGIVLGCTHFLFLQNEFRAAAAPDITVYDSVEGVCHRAELIVQGKHHAAAVPPLPPVLIVTGDTPLEDSWRRWAETFGMNAVCLKELS